MHSWWWHRWTGDDFIGLAHATVDVLVVAYLVYRLLILAKGTRAWQIFTGLLVVFVILQLSDWWQLTGLKWLLQQMFQLGPVAIVILFYPELRHALEDFGRRGFWGQNFAVLEKEDVSLMVGEIVEAASNLADKKMGALVVLERETGLTDIIETGTRVDGAVTAELLGTLFYPGAPLHDGAAVVQRGRIIAAGCTLPLSESREIGTTVHTRHKAALGMSEQSDALVLVVSEETGIISLAFNGKMVRGLRDDALRDRLMQAYMGRERLADKRRRSAVRPAARPPASPFKSIAPFLTIRHHDRPSKAHPIRPEPEIGGSESAPPPA